MSDKKYSPKEAALAVLKKAEELYKASDLAKGDWAKIHSKLKREGYSEESADKIDGAIKAKLGKSEENPDEKQDAQLGEEVEHAVEDHEKHNAPAEAKEAGMKGHLKLAKFVGRMEHKRGQSKSMDKSAPMAGAQPAAQAATPAQARAPQAAPAQAAAPMAPAAAPPMGKSALAAAPAAQPTKGAHEQVLDQIHQMSKPKLPG